MILSLLISVAALATPLQANSGSARALPAKASPLQPPALPPLTSQLFQDEVIKVEELLAARDFPGAERAAALLPKDKFSIDLESQKAPERLREAFKASYGRAISAWRIRGIFPSKTPDLKITFAPQLAIDPETDAPANVATFYSDAPGSPRLTVVIGLHRDKPLRDATPADIFNDVRYAIGAYLGLTTHNVPEFVMTTSAQVDDARNLTAPEIHSAAEAMALTFQLRAAVVSHQTVGVSGRPEATLAQQGFSGTAVQGDQVPLPIQVTNHGTGTLTLNALGDCGCIVPESGPPIGPGKTGILSLRLETHEYTDPIERHVYVFTNDPKHSIFTVKVHLDISPRYRIVLPEGSTWVFDKGSKEGDAYVWFPDGSDMLVTNARVIGMDKCVVTFEPWKGTMPDSERKEGPMPRHGFRVHMTIPDTLPPGRSPVTLALLTSSAEFPIISQSIYLQRGIVSLPEELFIGEVGSQTLERTLVLSRPGQPFQVKAVSSTNKSFTVRSEPGDKEGEQKLKVKYLGNAPPGGISGFIKVETDDPKQPVVFVALAGSAT